MRSLNKLWLHYQAKTALFFGRQARARELYQALVQQFPADIHARICLGNLAAKAGDMSAAFLVFRQAAEQGNATGGDYRLFQKAPARGHQYAVAVVIAAITIPTVALV